MRNTLSTIAAGIVCFAALPALAEGWTAIDLGNTDTEAGCVARAEQMFEKFGEYYEFHSTDSQTWTVAGYDLTHDDFDGLVSCAYGPDDKTRATLVVHSVGAAPDAKRSEIAQSLKDIWNAQ